MSLAASSKHKGPTALRRTPAYLPTLLSLGLVLLLILPIGVLLTRAFSPDVFAHLLNPTALEAIRLSLLTTALSLTSIVFLGTPLAYLLARYHFRGKQILDAFINLPIVLPPVVAGVALLLVFGRRGLIGEPLSNLGINLSFTTTAVVIAQVFVASPFYVRALKVGFMAVPQELEAAALTDGADRWVAFWRITLPLTLPAFIEGLILAWARALGEFGATIIFAGSLAGRTRTLPLAIYASLERDLASAIALSTALSVMALILFFVIRVVSSSNPVSS